MKVKATQGEGASRGRVKAQARQGKLEKGQGGWDRAGHEHKHGHGRAEKRKGSGRVRVNDDLPAVKLAG